MENIPMIPKDAPIIAMVRDLQGGRDCNKLPEGHEITAERFAQLITHYCVGTLEFRQVHIPEARTHFDMKIFRFYDYDLGVAVMRSGNDVRFYQVGSDALHQDFGLQFAAQFIGDNS